MGGEDDVAGGKGTPGSSSAAKKAVKFPRGKKCAVAVGSADPDVDRTPIELPYTCDGCHNYILGTRYNCGGCEDFDVCEQCFRKYQDGDPDHVHEHPPSVFIAVLSAEEEEAAADARAKSGQAPGAAGRGAEDEEVDARGDAAADDEQTPVPRGSDGVGGAGESGVVRMHARFTEDAVAEAEEAVMVTPAPSATVAEWAPPDDDGETTPRLESHPLSPAAFRS